LNSSADPEPVIAGKCAGLSLVLDDGAAFLHARSPIPSPGLPGLLLGPIDSGHISLLFSAREHLASPWLDLAEGRLRLDRLTAMAAVRLSSPGLATPRKTRGPRFAHSSRGKKVSPPPSSAALRP
jgi:hypothetical protein